jgi:hypothetical protein
MDMDDEGEPIAFGQVDRKGADTRALRDTLFTVAFFGGVWLVNGILVILLIALLQAIGWWETSDVLPAGEGSLLSLCARAGTGMRAGATDGGAGA